MIDDNTITSPSIWMAEDGEDASPAETDVTFVKESPHQHNRGKQTRQLFLILWILQLGMGMSSESQNSCCKARAKGCVWFTSLRELFLWNMDWWQPTLPHCSLPHMDRQFQPKVLNVHCHLSPLRPYHDSDEPMKLGEIRHTPQTCKALFKVQYPNRYLIQRHVMSFNEFTITNH